MKKERIELTPEQREALNESNKRQYSLVAAIVWTVCSAAWLVTLVMDFTNDAATLQIVMHVICAVLTATSAVLHFLRWREMKKTPSASEPAPEEETANTP